MLALQIGTPDEGALPPHRTERRAYDLVADGFGPGINGPLVVAVDISKDPSVVAPLARAIRADRGVASVAPPEVDADAGVATLVAFPTTGPQDSATLDTVERLRADVIPSVLGQSPARAHIGGQTASFADVGDKVNSRLPLFIGAVIVLSVLLLTLVFRSVVVPIKAALLNLLSVGAAFGVIVMVFQWGWGADLIGLESTDPDRAVHPDVHVRDPVRPVDGLRGVPALPGARGVPAHQGQRQLGHPRHRHHRAGHHVRRADHDLGLHGLRPRRRPDGEGARTRSGHGDLRRRDPRATGPGPGHDEAARRRQLVDPRLARPTAPHHRRRGRGRPTPAPDGGRPGSRSRHPAAPSTVRSVRAIVQDAYGALDSLALREVERPEPADDEVLIRVRAASVHPDVWHVVTGRPAVLRLMGSGVRRPKDRVPGTDAAGVVETVGAAVTRFRPGDEVFAETLRGIQWRNGGAFAEYATAPEYAVALKPSGLSFEEAAAVPTAGLIALHNLPQRRVSPGDRVLVNGAAGGVGAIAVQLAKAYGAHVTGVDHPRKLALVRSLGADQVIDYTREDYTRSGERWDLVFDVPGNHSFASNRRALVPRGAYVLIGHDAYGAGGHHWVGNIPLMLGLVVRSAVVPELRGGSFASPDKRALMATLTQLLEAGELRIVVDRTFPLSQASEALRYLTSGQAVGRIVLTVGD